jgi:uncharacterized protein YgiB involved in biofilm formation
VSFKRSKSITLVLIASLTTLTTGCSEDPGTQQLYSSRGDCLNDWQEERYCEPNVSSSYPSTHYYGPRYYVEGNEVRAMMRNGQMETVNQSVPMVRSLSTGGGSGHSLSATRGGFGGSSSAHVGRGGS